MSSPQRSTVQHQGPACHCQMNGKCIGWLSCTAYAVAMDIDKATLGKKRPSGCIIRRLTGDDDGGTTLPQCCGVARNEYGVVAEVRVGSNVASPTYAAGQLRAGRGITLQGNTGPVVRTTFRSTGGPVNHAIHLNDGRGWHRDSAGRWIPKEVLVYDPAADGRRAGWGTADVSPSWWPWSLVLAFAAALRPWGDRDSRVLGSGKWYCAIWADTEPHVHLRFTGSVKTSPFPRMLKVRSRFADNRPVKVWAGPNQATSVGSFADGSSFLAYQQNNQGLLLLGSKLWFGDHDGKRWIHSSGVVV